MKQKSYLICLLVLLLTLMASGCGSQEPGDNESQLKLATPELSGCYDPFFSMSIYDSDIYELMYDSLVKQDTNGAVVPSLADYTVSDDGLTYTFNLKDVSYWNGEPVLPEDFLLAIKVYADPSYTGFFDIGQLQIEGLEEFRAGETESISGITCSGNSLTIRVLEPIPSALPNFAISPLCVSYYADAYTYGDLSGIIEKLQKPMSTGLYQFNEYVTGQFLSVKKNPNYFNGPANLEEIVFVPVADDVALETLLAQKVGMGLIYPDAGVLEQLKKSVNISYTQTANPGITAIILNQSIEKFSDARVRQAIACALPREELTTQFYGEDAWVINAPIIKCWDIAVPDGLDEYAFDLTRSEKLLAEAGYVKNSEGLLEKDGEVLSLLYSIDPSNPFSRAVAGYLSDNLGKLGITVTTENLDFASLINNLCEGKLEAFMMGMELTADPNPLEIFHSMGYNNLSFYSDPEADAMMEQLLTETDSAKKQQLYESLWQKLNADLPMIFLYERNDLWVYDSRLKGLNLHPFATAADRIQNAYFAD